MESKATSKFIRVSARKARLVADMVKGKPVEDAMNILRLSPQKSAGLIFKVMHSALANAEQLPGIDVDAMTVKQVIVNEGPSWKRFLPRSQGRANRIQKRTSHITVILEES